MHNLQEIWLPVKGFESAYMVSNTGKVKTIGRYIKRRWETPIYYPSKDLSTRIDRYGYCKISLYNNGDIKHTTLHRLVADMFIPNPDSKESVNHKDANKLNNCVDNLEWVTCKENIMHAEQMGLRNKNRNEKGQFV